MIKKILAVFFVLAISVSFCACDDLELDISDILGGKVSGDIIIEPPTQTVSRAQAPEEIVKDFMKAYYCRDAVKFFEYIPEFTYEAMIKGFEISCEEGDEAGAVLFEFLKSEFDSNDEPVAESVELVTEISGEATKQDYIAAVRDYYVKEGFMSEAEMDIFEDAVFVNFSGKVTYPDGSETSMGANSCVPCMKIDGEWYVDFFFAAIVVVPEPEVIQGQATIRPIED